MNKIFEPHTTREQARHLPETHEDLPKLPDDVTIPDDISGLAHPDMTKTRRPASGIRWLHWLPAVLLLVAGVIALALVLRGDSSDGSTEIYAEPGGPAAAEYLPATSGEVYNYNPSVRTTEAPTLAARYQQTMLPAQTQPPRTTVTPTLAARYEQTMLATATVMGPTLAARNQEALAEALPASEWPEPLASYVQPQPALTTADYLPVTSGEVYNHNPSVATTVAPTLAARYQQTMLPAQTQPPRTTVTPTLAARYQQTMLAGETQPLGEWPEPLASYVQPQPALTTADYLPATSGEVYNHNPSVRTTEAPTLAARYQQTMLPAQTQPPRTTVTPTLAARYQQTMLAAETQPPGEWPEPLASYVQPQPALTTADYLPVTSGEVYNYNPPVTSSAS